MKRRSVFHDEYRCLDCESEFPDERLLDDEEDAIVCPYCGSDDTELATDSEEEE